MYLFGRAATGNDADLQTFQLVDDPLPGGTDLLGHTPTLGQLLRFLGLAHGYGDGERAKGDGSASPLVDGVDCGFEKDERVMWWVT